MIVAVYARISTARQAEMDLSIPDQVRQIREWCAGQGHSVAVEYIEPGASATDDQRPFFQQMISKACADPAPFDTIMVHSLSGECPAGILQRIEGSLRVQGCRYGGRHPSSGRFTIYT